MFPLEKRKLLPPSLDELNNQSSVPVTITGHVKWPNGKPINKAIIKDVRSGKQAYTDASGNYILKLKPHTKFEIILEGGPYYATNGKMFGSTYPSPGDHYTFSATAVPMAAKITVHVHDVNGVPLKGIKILEAPITAITDKDGNASFYTRWKHDQVWVHIRKVWKSEPDIPYNIVSASPHGFYTPSNKRRDFAGADGGPIDMHQDITITLKGQTPPKAKPKPKPKLTPAQQAQLLQQQQNQQLQQQILQLQQAQAKAQAEAKAQAIAQAQALTQAQALAQAQAKAQQDQQLQQLKQLQQIQQSKYEQNQTPDKKSSTSTYVIAGEVAVALLLFFFL